MTIEKALNFIRNTLETVVVAAVKALKAHTFDVKVSNRIEVSNLPASQKITGQVEVTNQKATLDALKVVADQLTQLKTAIQAVDIPSTVTVGNLKDLHLPEPLKKVEVANPTKEVSITNLNALSEGLQRLEKAIGKLPTIYPETKIPPFPEIEIPDTVTIANPVKEVAVSNLETLKSDDPTQSVPVRLSDGKKFYKALEELSVAGGRANSFSDEKGVKMQALIDKERRAVVYVDEFRLNEQKKIDNVTYLGYEDRYGAWYLMKITGGELAEDDKTFRFATVTNNPTINTYAGAWNNKLTLQFDRYSVAF